VSATAPEPSAGHSPDSDPRGRRREVLAGLLIVAAAVAVVAYKRVSRAVAPRPSEEQCTELLDRYLRHASRARTPDISERAIRDAQDKSRGSALRLADVKACRTQLTAQQVDCGLRSPNVDELERCMQ
jgi:hypothetical protein